MAQRSLKLAQNDYLNPWTESYSTIHAVIFDFDGLIINSEAAHSLAFETVVRQLGGTPRLNEHNIIQTVGISELDNWERLRASYGLPNSAEELKLMRAQVYLDILKKDVDLMPGVVGLIKELSKTNKHLAIATGSDRIHIDVILEKFGLEDYFSVFVTREDVARGKPHPDIFLKTAELLGVAPENCAVLEDSENGIKSAKSAGMLAIAVPNIFTRDHDFSTADYIEQSINKTMGLLV